MTGLERARERYAQQIRERRGLTNERLVRAFATVPREHYLGPGPWRVLKALQKYETTPDADPVHLYANVLVAIDESRRLNNGEPSALATWFEQLDLAEGGRVLHVGCGVGYYTAILAETVGPGGAVTGVEIDAELAVRAESNLAHLAHVDVVCGDGSRFAAGPFDAIFVNAGATEPRRNWPESLAPGGILALPLTASLDQSGMGAGWVLRVVRREGGYEAGFTTPVGVFPCLGARSDESDQALREAYKGGHAEVRSLRLDAHDATDACWLHGDGFCLSRAEPA